MFAIIWPQKKLLQLEEVRQIECMPYSSVKLPFVAVLVDQGTGWADLIGESTSLSGC